MKRLKTKFAKCPCCLIEKDQTEMKTCVSILEKLERKEFKHYIELKLDRYTYSSFIEPNFGWACDNCLETKKAVLASPRLQETTWTPHLAYSDTKLFCFSCKKDFLFKKEEKKVWYESYKLPTNAAPNNCLDCRRKISNQNLENKTLSEILKKEEFNISDKELEKVVELYSLRDKMDRAKYFQSILNKRNKNYRK